MSIKYDKGFYIFQRKTFKNWEKLNDAGLTLLEILTDIMQDIGKKQDFYENVTDIFVTSQDRQKRNKNHNSGNAIDITVYPAGMNVWLFKELSSYANTIYISSHNKHLHFDLRQDGLYGVEVLEKNGQLFYPGRLLTDAEYEQYEIKIKPIETHMKLIFEKYEVFKLNNLKTGILMWLANPFVNAKKIYQRGKAIEKEIWNETFPDDNKILWYIGGGLLAFLFLKGGDKVVIYKDK